MEPLVPEFVAHLRSRRASDSSTPRTYGWAAQALLDFLAAHELGLDAISPGIFQAFADWTQQQRRESGRPWSTAACHTAIKGARAFLRWAHAQGHLVVAPETGQPRLPPLVHLREDEPIDPAGYASAVKQLADPVRAVLALLPLTEATLRDLCTAPLAGMASGALHVRRHAPLDVRQLARLGSAECERHLHRVTLTPVALGEVQAYGSRYRRAVEGSPWLFPSPAAASAPLPEGTVRAALRRLRKRLGSPSLSPRGLRATGGGA